MIEMINVYKKYPNGIVAANGIDVKIEQGDFVYVVGPSGAGKSTFIKMMYREERPTTGDILINGVNLATLKNNKVPYLRRQIGVVFQDFKLLPRLNVYENVAFALEVIEETPKVIRKKVMDVLELVGLKHKARMFPTELSGGEQQRVSIARSIVNTPKLVIADEPTGNLDPETSWEIMNIFEEINARGTTIIMATHNREIVNTIRHRVIAVEGGLITRDDTEENTVMKGRTLGRHFRESIKSISRNGWMTFASVSAVTVTLLLVGVFVMIMMNLNKVADDLEKDVEIKVYVELTSDEASITKLEQEIKETKGVEEVKYSPKGDELNKLVVDFGEDLRLFEQQNPLHNVFYAKATNPQETEAVAEKLDRLDNTFEVKYGEGKIEKLFSFLNTGRNVGLVLILALLFTAMFLISNTIRITIVARRRDIEIMKLVGATNWFIRIPFILEGMWLGILGAIVPITLVTVLYYNIYNLLAPKLEQGKLFELLEFSPFIYQVNGLILLMGILIGVWGSFMSVRKFLRV